MSSDRFRTVSTVEECEALPVGSVLRDAVGRVWERWPDRKQSGSPWRVTGATVAAPSSIIELPAIVLDEVV